MRNLEFNFCAISQGENGENAQNIILAGDSAGGGMTFMVLKFIEIWKRMREAEVAAAAEVANRSRLNSSGSPSRSRKGSMDSHSAEIGSNEVVADVVKPMKSPAMKPTKSGFDPLSSPLSQASTCPDVSGTNSESTGVSATNSFRLSMMTPSASSPLTASPVSSFTPVYEDSSDGVDASGVDSAGGSNPNRREKSGSVDFELRLTVTELEQSDNSAQEALNDNSVSQPEVQEKVETELENQPSTTEKSGYHYHMPLAALTFSPFVKVFGEEENYNELEKQALQITGYDDWIGVTSLLECREIMVETARKAREAEKQLETTLDSEKEEHVDSGLQLAEKPSLSHCHNDLSADQLKELEEAVGGKIQSGPRPDEKTKTQPSKTETSTSTSNKPVSAIATQIATISESILKKLEKKIDDERISEETLASLAQQQLYRDATTTLSPDHILLPDGVEQTPKFSTKVVPDEIFSSYVFPNSFFDVMGDRSLIRHSQRGPGEKGWVKAVDLSGTTEESLFNMHQVQYLAKFKSDFERILRAAIGREEVPGDRADNSRWDGKGYFSSVPTLSTMGESEIVREDGEKFFKMCLEVLVNCNL